MKKSQVHSEESSVAVSNIGDANGYFAVLQTTSLSQTAVMRLRPGQHSSEELNVHEKSDQVLLLVEGELQGLIGTRKLELKKGDFCIIPAGTPHQFDNTGQHEAVTFNVYSPPEYPSDEKD
jgi:mannose-6-phosphate isomerase-like protein (cupin superfamily)